MLFCEFNEVIGSVAERMCMSSVLEIMTCDGDYLSDATMKILRLTVKYLPLPAPASMPTDPGGRSWRKRSTTGHGFVMISIPVKLIVYSA
jgi:hypothetical protein